MRGKQRKTFESLATRLGEWPLLLGFANAALRKRIGAGQDLAGALRYVNKALDRRGLTAFDAKKPEERHQAASRTLDVSLDLLDENERARYRELAIFPEDTDVPLETLEKLWGATGELDDFETEALCERLRGLSLLWRFDPNDRVIRLHDVVRLYLREETGGNAPKLHSEFLDAYERNTWTGLSVDERYLWRHLAYHLVEAGRTEELHRLLLDFDWLRAKLDASDIASLIRDYDWLAARPQAETQSPTREGGVKGATGARDTRPLSHLQSALRLSAHVLARDRNQLAGQLIGRLMQSETREIQLLVQQADQNAAAPWLRPLTPSLTPPGGPLLRTLSGHSGWFTAVALTGDGRRAVSASDDQTLKVWDLESGEELRTLEGHSGGVNAVALTEDGRRAVSASDDETLKVWDLESGEVLRTLEGHSGGVRSVALTGDGRRAVSASDDQTLKVWDLESGEAPRTLQGHSSVVWSVALTGGGRSRPPTIRR